jgi:hypothetical protein
LESSIVTGRNRGETVTKFPRHVPVFRSWPARVRVNVP